MSRMFAKTPSLGTAPAFPAICQQYRQLSPDDKNSKALQYRISINYPEYPEFSNSNINELFFESLPKSFIGFVTRDWLKTRQIKQKITFRQSFPPDF